MACPEKLTSFFYQMNKKYGHLIVLRGYDGLPSRYSNDIDIFVPLNKLPEFFLALEKIEDIKASFEITVCRPGLIKSNLCLDNDKIPLDILYNFSYLGLEYQNLYTLETNAKQHSSKLFKIPDCSDELRISLLKELLHNNRVRKDKVLQLLSLWKKDGCCPSSDLLTVKNCEFIKMSIENERTSFAWLGRNLKCKLFFAALIASPIQTFERILAFVYTKYLSKKQTLNSNLIKWTYRRSINKNWMCDNLMERLLDRS